ncbi:hypothetical protein [Streptococcus dysgalactiae]|nr:hypothetical protein [Streptococcus dysgalactiae]VTS27636.1 Uncharacterised protein [Streptococcus dysgalactiae subsp. equisimilis]VTS37292.1 Uncharacterised protein [Streptococcus dysgalactiae subsp. equisimilis]
MLQMFKDILKYLSTINTILLFLILAFFISPTSLRDVIDVFHPLIDQFHLSSHYWGQLYIVITIICIIPDILKNFYDDISDIILIICFNAWQSANYIYLICCLYNRKLILLPIDNFLVFWIIYLSVAATIFSISKFILDIYKSALATGHWIILHIVIIICIICYFIPFDIFKSMIHP